MESLIGKRQKRDRRRLWGTASACLAVAAFIVIANLTRPDSESETPPPVQEGETMLATENLNIYYLSENGIIESKSIEVRCTPEGIFNEWAVLNQVSGVTLVDCVYDDGGSEKQHGDTIEHTLGGYYTLNLTVSTEFSEYAESENGNLLIQSLRQTFFDYSYFDEFHLTVSD